MVGWGWDGGGGNYAINHAMQITILSVILCKLYYQLYYTNTYVDFHRPGRDDELCVKHGLLMLNRQQISHRPDSVLYT